MDSTRAPHGEQDPQTVLELVQTLNGSNKAAKPSKGFRAKKTTFNVAGSPDNISVDSWRFQEWDYKRRDLPIYARGLFTTKNRRNDHEIAVRGYDKFFNTGEVNETRWENIRSNTRGPYELTLKENGCIIFISGLEDETLLVCSKHSTGARNDVEVSHASAGDRWVDRQLASIGKTREEFARELRSKNITAVAELCDDGFEEHILAYGADKAGLYLHGINLNLPDFTTYPSSQVHEFADKWGFRKVGLQIFHDIDAVKTFLDTIAETGAHEGRDVEGFVVRCQRSPNPGGKLPYGDWFFKYKFEEPYLMYRQWRECTKALIGGRAPKYKKHVKITEEYLFYARKALASNPGLAKAYNQNHGIIKLRDDFLAFKNMKGSDAANWEAEFGEDNTAVTNDIVLVPISTIGCGKTTIGVALTHLFDWGIVQNDNIQGKGRPARMVSAVLQELMKHPVVMSDRNNSERRERDQIIKDILTQHKSARLVALNFAHGDVDEVRRVTRERVINRGDNHQTIQAATAENKVIGIMENFIHRFQPCDPANSPDDSFDLIIDLDPAKGSRVNVETVIRELKQKYPALIPEMPSAEDMDAAVKGAIEDYKPDLRHTIPDRTDRRDKNKSQKQQQPVAPAGAAAAAKKKPLEYMAVSVPAKDVQSALDSIFNKTDPQAQHFYRLLGQTRRMQRQFHVTLMHRFSAKTHPELWARYTSLEAANANNVNDTLGECEVVLESVVWDDRIMAIAVSLVDPEGQWTCVNKVPHITIGTRDDSIKPKESNDLLAKKNQVGAGGSTGIWERTFDTKPTLKGSVRAVLSR
ncbi:tRNA ligase [Xylariaceae sp. FL1019]|nr:tRNA ligase [Xylariaceae sp. FL1019]